MTISYLSKIFEKLSFYKIVVARFIIILFRKRKEIDMLRLDYNSEHLFENSFILINYRFRNAIYYKFGNHKTLEKEIKIFNLKNIEKEQTLTVYGFFRKKTYKIIFNPNLELNTSNFGTEFSNLKVKLEETKPIKIQFEGKTPMIKNFEINNSKIKIETRKLIIKNNSYNQNEFI